MTHPMRASSGSQAPGPDAVGQIGGLNEIADFDAPTLTAIVARLERSSSLEHLIYREAELDEVWRLVDGALREARRTSSTGEAATLLEALKDLVFKVHDLVGVDSDPQAAAVELRGGLFLALKYANLRP